MQWNVLNTNSPANAGFIYLYFIYLFIMFTVEYWNETAAEWRGTGSGTICDRDMARVKMRALSEMCDYCTRFRIVEMSTL